MSQKSIKQLMKEFETQLRGKIAQKNATNMNEVQFLQKMFKYFDIQNSGKVDFDQFFRSMEKTGIIMEKSDLLEIFRRIDKNGDGHMDYKEFSTVFFSNEMQKTQQSNDPYIQEKQRQMAASQAASRDAPEALLALFRDKLKGRGAKGMIGLQRLFKIMDDDGTQTLSLPEFSKACRDFRIGISDENVPILFSKFDVNNDGTISYDEFLNSVRDPMNERRVALVEKAFHSIDQNGNGFIEVSDIKASYNARKHPDVLQGKRTEDSILVEFLETFEAHHNLKTGQRGDGNVTLEEFVDYYGNISSSIDNDEYFELMINNAWNVKGDAATYKSYEKGWVNDDKPVEFRTTHAPRAVQRSGMQSKDNPLFHTQGFYGEKMTASRGNVSGAMYNNPQKIMETIPEKVQPSGIAFPSQKSKAVPAQANTANFKAGFKIESKPPVPKFQGILIERFRKSLKSRGANGIIGLSRQFKIADDNGSGTLDFMEFKKCVHDFGLDIDPQDVESLFKSMDIDQSGEIDFNEFLRVVVGEMSQFRRNLVERAFRTLDVNLDNELEVKEFSQKYNGMSHPDVRTGKKTEAEVLVEFMETFERHHALVADKSTSKDGKVTLEEFIEYYNNVSCSIENDSYFDLMISNAWGLEGGSNPASMPYAGTAMKVAHVNAREAYRRDHHRNLFGTDTETPFTKQQGGRNWQSSSKLAMSGNEIFSGQAAAGSNTIHNKDAYKNQFGSTRDTGAGYTGIQHKDDELILKLREKLASRGARGLIGLQRIFKILDDSGDGRLEIQEFWKGLCDFRLKFSQEECRQLFQLFDQNDDGFISFDELLHAVKGDMSPFRKDLIKRVFKKLDFNENGYIDIDDVRKSYNARQHPDVRAGKKTEEEVLQEFLETFEAHRAMNSQNDKYSKQGDGQITLNEFFDYYSNVSASIDNEEYFQLMITNAWNLNNKQYSKAVRMEY